MGHKEMGLRLDAYNLAFLREVIGGLQSRCLQETNTSYLLSVISISKGKQEADYKYLA